MAINIIVAMDKNRVIGKDNHIPWRLKNDRQRFKSLVTDRIVILGRKTYDSLAEYYDKSGRTMPSRTYIIATRQSDYKTARENTLITNTLDEAIKKAHKLSNEIFVIGGAQVYEQSLALADRLYITEVDAEVEGDTAFPVIDLNEWIEITREKYFKDEDHTYDYSYVMFDRIKK